MMQRKFFIKSLSDTHFRITKDKMLSRKRVGVVIGEWQHDGEDEWTTKL